MSFLAKLQQLKQNAKVTEKNFGNAGKSNKVNTERKTEEGLPMNYVREVDPAIKRLKEARRLKNGENTKTTVKATTRKNAAPKNELPIYKNKPGVNTTDGKASELVKREPMKKLSFNELMQQADKRAEQQRNGMSNTSPKYLKSRIDIRKRSPKPTAKDSVPRSCSKSSTSQQIYDKNLKNSSSKKSELRSRSTLNTLSNIAQPNAKLAKALKVKDRQKTTNKKSSRYADLDDDLSDFIDDDDEALHQSNVNSYDRDEIWSIFNKGRKRHYESESSDDNMEANEMEILEEEEYAEKMARLEDKREEVWLKRHEKQKRERKK